MRCVSKRVFPIIQHAVCLSENPIVYMILVSVSGYTSVAPQNKLFLHFYWSWSNSVDRNYLVSVIIFLTTNLETNIFNSNQDRSCQTRENEFPPSHNIHDIYPNIEPVNYISYLRENREKSSAGIGEPRVVSSPHSRVKIFYIQVRGFQFQHQK